MLGLRNSPVPLHAPHQYSHDYSHGSFLVISTHLLAQILECPFLALHSSTSTLLVLGRAAFHIFHTHKALATSRRKAARGSCRQSGIAKSSATKMLRFGPPGGGRLGIPATVRGYAVVTSLRWYLKKHIKDKKGKVVTVIEGIKSRVKLNEITTCNRRRNVRVS